MSCHTYQDLLHNVTQAFPEVAMETLIEMQCSKHGLFGTGGFDFAGTSFLNPLPFSTEFHGLSNYSHNLLSTSPPTIKLAPELQLAIQTLDKVAQASSANLEIQSTKLPEYSREEPIQKDVQELKRIPIKICGFQSEMSTEIPMEISPEFCHGWWSSESTEEGERPASDNRTAHPATSTETEEQVGTHTTTTSSTRTNISAKSTGKRGRKPAGKRCDQVGEDDDDSHENVDSSLTIEIDGDEEDSDDDHGRRKRPNTHKKGTIPRPKEEVPRNDDRKPEKSSRKRKSDSPRPRSLRSQASRSPQRANRYGKSSKRAP